MNKSKAAELYGRGYSASGREYDEWTARMSSRFSRLGDAPLFTTDADLWGAYLASFSPSAQQFHSCHACRHFIERFGGLVEISAAGHLVPAFWAPEGAPPEFEAAAYTLYNAVKRAKITGVFITADAVLGTPRTGCWTHFAASMRGKTLHTRRDLTPHQAAAEKFEDYRNIQRALADFDALHVQRAVELLRSGALIRADKVLPGAEWLADLHAQIAGNRARRDNIVWRAVATAPAGFCHPRASMLGTLVDDIRAGLEGAAIAAKWAEKMDPLAYLRPKAAPTVGAIAAAERLFEQLGLARSLERRFARLEDLRPHAFWLPTPEPTRATSGLFGHLAPTSLASSLLWGAGTQNITFAKFIRTILPDARTIQVFAPAVGHYRAYTTAVHDDAPQILRWDNAISNYEYHQGSPAHAWGLRGGVWYDATALVPVFAHESATFLISPARAPSPGHTGLFPEALRGDLHSARSVLEAFSRSAPVGGREAGDACGLSAIGATVRVRTKSGVGSEYIIDRWE